MSAVTFSPSRRVAQAIAEVGAGVVPVVFLLYALLASGCSAPTPQRAPNLQSALSQRVDRTSPPVSVGNGSGDFTALIVLEDQPIPSLAATSASYAIPVDSAIHSVAGGQALGARLSDDAGSPWLVFALAQDLWSAGESVMVALPASLYAPGSVALDGSQAVAYLVDAWGNLLAYTSSGTLTLTAAPLVPGQLAAGSFSATFASVAVAPGCAGDADCAAGEVCVSGTCVIPDCTITGCPAGMRCDPSAGGCVPAGCAGDADCGPGLVCRSGQCVASPTCPIGLLECAGGCVDPMSDPAHCGGCGLSCARGESCLAGVCSGGAGCALTGCPAGQVCDAATGQCVVVAPACAADADCGPGQACQAGQCVPLATGNGSGSFTALVVDGVDQAIPSLSGTAAEYSVAVAGAIHSLAAGQALGAQMTDDAGSPWFVLWLAPDFYTPSEAVVVMVPASLYAPGTVALDGYQAVAVLVDEWGNLSAYTTSGTLTLTAAPQVPGQLAQGSFAGTFEAATSPGCAGDADCARGELCVSGTCMVADCTVTGCPAGMTCDWYSGKCVGGGVCPGGLIDCAGLCVDPMFDPAHCGGCGMSCAWNEYCERGACTGGDDCTVNGCPAGMTCDWYTRQCLPAQGCRSDAECGPGMVCLGGQCAPAGCWQTGCPAGLSCDYTTGQCVPGSTTGNCFPASPLLGSGGFTGSAGEVPMCPAAGLGSLSGGPDAAMYDGEDEHGLPATVLVVGDLQAGGETYFVAVLDHCPGVGETLSAPATRFLVLHQSVTADTILQVQKRASSGTLSFSAGAGGAVQVQLSATFGTDTVTGSAFLTP